MAEEHEEHKKIKPEGAEEGDHGESRENKTRYDFQYKNAYRYLAVMLFLLISLIVSYFVFVDKYLVLQTFLGGMIYLLAGVVVCFLLSESILTGVSYCRGAGILRPDRARIEFCYNNRVVRYDKIRSIHFLRPSRGEWGYRIGMGIDSIFIPIGSDEGRSLEAFMRALGERAGIPVGGVQELTASL